MGYFELTKTEQITLRENVTDSTSQWHKSEPLRVAFQRTEVLLCSGGKLVKKPNFCSYTTEDMMGQLHPIDTSAVLH